MNKFVQAIRSQEAYKKKPKPPRENVMVNRRPPVKESEIMQILTMHEMGNPAPQISKDTGVPVQTVYNVRQRYMLIDVKNGKKWYKYLGF